MAGRQAAARGSLDASRTRAAVAVVARIPLQCVMAMVMGADSLYVHVCECVCRLVCVP